MVTLYDVGDIARLTAVFKDINLALADPTTVTAKVRKPDGTVSSFIVAVGQIVRDSVGVFHLDVTVDTVGEWWYQFAGTGAITDTGEHSFTARNTNTVLGAVSAAALTTLSSAREYVLRDETDDSQDTKLARLINAYSVAVSGYTRRQWATQTAVTKRFAYDGSGYLSLDPYEATTVTSITMYTDLPTSSQRLLTVGSPTVEGEYRLHPPGQTPEGTYQWVTLPNAGRIGLPSFWNNPYPWGPVGMAAPDYFEVSILGNWGIATVPDDVELAVLIAVDDAFKNPTGFASGEVGGESFIEQFDVQAGPESRARNLPIDARALLTPYKRGSDVVVA